MKKCELCNSVARMYCDSDQASLCWDCDGRVHAANFLVSKHSRTLLCHSCQSPTPWTGSGSRLGPTLSLCHTCFAIKHSASSAHSYDHHENNDHDVVDDDDDDDNDDDDDDDDDDEEEEGENQVVPLPSSSSSMNHAVISDSSTSGEESFNGFDKSGIGFSGKSQH